MLELGREVSGFTLQQLPRNMPQFEMPIGKKWLLLSGEGLGNLQHPMTQWDYELMLAFRNPPRHAQHIWIRDLYDVDGDDWTV